MRDERPFDFSPLAASYARGRPRYPAALYDWLASLLDRRELAWDCATGNGQAAEGLAAHFARVVATDASAEQIRHAAPHPRIEYRVARAEASGLAPASADLATVASALHWVDAPAYFDEVRRVVRPGGVFAAWVYHAGTVEPPFDEAFHRFYWEIAKPHFAAGTDLVDAGYRTIPMPGEPIPAPPFAIEVEWTRAQVLDYVASWSALPAARAARGDDPTAGLAAELELLYAGRTTLPFRMPLVVHARRL